MPNCLFYTFFRLCDEFERISEKALTAPSNTQELMELKVLSSFFYESKQEAATSTIALALSSSICKLPPLQV